MQTDILNLTNSRDACTAELDNLNKINCAAFLIPVEERGHLIPTFDPSRLDELRELEAKKQQLRARIDLIDQRIIDYHDFLARTGIKSLEELRRKQAVLRIELRQLEQKLNSEDDQARIEREIAEIDIRIREGIEITTL